MSAAKLLATTTTQSHQMKRGSVEQEEEDCGFVFRRKTAKAQSTGKDKPADKKETAKIVNPKNNSKINFPAAKKTAASKAPVTKGKSVGTAQKPATTVKTVAPSKPRTPTKPKAAAANTPIPAQEPSINPTPSKRQVLERQRRRSSLTGLALSGASRRRSSIGIGFSQELPAESVRPEEYHRHILPDLPGPLKMKQLLIWAVQKASREMTSNSSSHTSAEWEECVSEPICQGLHTNQLSTSWYQRPNTGGDVARRPNPVNTDMRECLGLYQKYYKQLSTELGQWRALESSQHSLPVPQIPIDMGMVTRSPEIQSVCKWMHRLPFHVDRLGWLLQVYGAFEGRSKEFCEDVFRQIFDRFFHGQTTTNTGTCALPVLRALSDAQP